jgi:hypothetical protein
MDQPPPFWFAAKRYGYGWGFPVRWQGWIVFVVYFALLFAGIAYFASHREQSEMIVYLIVLTVAFVAIIAFKGERPLRWRWGGK